MSDVDYKDRKYGYTRLCIDCKHHKLVDEFKSPATGCTNLVMVMCSREDCRAIDARYGGGCGVRGRHFERGKGLDLSSPGRPKPWLKRKQLDSQLD